MLHFFRWSTRTDWAQGGYRTETDSNDQQSSSGSVIGFPCRMEWAVSSRSAWTGFPSRKLPYAFSPAGASK
jgi:hypothetical protein